jgi:hypothetical protein
MYAIAVHGYHHFINIFWELADANLGKEREKEEKEEKEGFY